MKSPTEEEWEEEKKNSIREDSLKYLEEEELTEEEKIKLDYDRRTSKKRYSYTS